MSDQEEETPAEPVKVKQVAIASGIVAAALTAAVAFTVAGPLGIGIAAAGVAGTGYTVHRVRNPRKGTLLQSLITRPRRSKTGGSLTWPFTGSQQKRALTRSARAGGQSSRTKLPSLTSTRAKRSGALTGTRSTGASKHAKRFSSGMAISRRPSTSTSARSTRRPTGGSLRSGVPGSKPVTPAKLTSSKPGLSTRSGRASSKRSLPSSLKSRTPLTGSSATRRMSGGTKTARRNGLPGSKGARKPSTRGPFSTTRRAGKWRNPFQGTRGGQSLGGRSTGSRKTNRARRLGGTLTPVQRRGPLAGLRRHVTPDRNRNRSPNRTALRPRPYRRSSTGRLLRTSLRLPYRRRTTPGSRRIVAPLKLPTRKQSARARRTLRLRSGVHLRRGAVWLAKTPARRWDRLWAKLPTAPMPLTHYTELATARAAAGRRHLRLVPDLPVPDPTPAPVRDITLTPIHRNGELIYVSDPNEAIMEAFQNMASFQPSSAREVEQWLQQQHETLQTVVASYGILADRMRDEMPFAAPVADSVREIGIAIGAAGGIAQSAHQTLRVAHEADIRRYEDPRPGEDMWNPEANR